MKAKIIAFVALNGNISTGNYLPNFMDIFVLDSFMISPTHLLFKDIIPVTWKSPTMIFVFEAELTGLIIVMEFAAKFGWKVILLMLFKRSKLRILFHFDCGTVGIIALKLV